MAAPWSAKRRSRCREMVLTLFTKGHLVDPMQDEAYQSLRQLRRTEGHRPVAFTELECVWHCSANGEAMCDGPVAVAHSILRCVDVHWQASCLSLHGRDPLGLLEGLESWWLHEIRQGMRLAERSRVGNRRRDMSGKESTAR